MFLIISTLYCHPRLVRGSQDTKNTEFVALDPRTRRGWR